MEQLSHRAMLASLKISRWSGSAVDREVTEDTNERYNADLKKAGRYTKSLVASHFMSDFNSACSAASATHKLLTSPWDDDGTRILTTRGHPAYTEQMRIRRHNIERAADELCTPEVMANIKADARQRLGAMYKEENYPPVDEIRAHIGMKVEIMPMPEVSDFRANLSADQVKVITRDIEKRIEARIQATITDVYLRAREVVTRMVETLKDEDKTVKHSLIVSVKELTDLMPSLNLTDDPKLEKLREQMVNDLTPYHPTDLQDDAKTRKKVGDQADRILRKINSVLA